MVLVDIQHPQQPQLRQLFAVRLMDILGLGPITMEDSMKVEQAAAVGVIATRSPTATVNPYGKYTPKPVVEMPTYS